MSPIRCFDWMFRDRSSGRVVIAQWPNLSLSVFAAASLVRLAVGREGSIGIAAQAVSAVSLIVWAGDEALRGVNPWRRSLGVAVLVGEAIRLAA